MGGGGDNIRMDNKDVGVNMNNKMVRLRIGIIGETCECGIEPSGLISHRGS